MHFKQGMSVSATCCHYVECGTPLFVCLVSHTWSYCEMAADHNSLHTTSKNQICQNETLDPPLCCFVLLGQFWVLFRTKVFYAGVRLMYFFHGNMSLKWTHRRSFVGWDDLQVEPTTFCSTTTGVGLLTHSITDAQAWAFANVPYIFHISLWQWFCCHGEVSLSWISEVKVLHHDINESQQDALWYSQSNEGWFLDFRSLDFISIQFEWVLCCSERREQGARCLRAFTAQAMSAAACEKHSVVMHASEA